MTQARAPLASDGDHEPSSKLPSLTRENYIRHIVFNRRMANVYRAIDQPGQVRKSKPPVRSSLQLLRWPQFIAQRHSDVNQPVYIRKARKKDGQINAPSCERLASQDDPKVSVFPSDGDGANSKSFGAVSMQFPRVAAERSTTSNFARPQSNRSRGGEGLLPNVEAAHFRPRWPLRSLHPRGPSPGQLANDDLFVSLSLQCSYW